MQSLDSTHTVAREESRACLHDPCPEQRDCNRTIVNTGLRAKSLQAGAKMPYHEQYIANPMMNERAGCLRKLS
jgi:hypothetical protein